MRLGLEGLGCRGLGFRISGLHFFFNDDYHYHYHFHYHTTSTSTSTSTSNHEHDHVPDPDGDHDHDHYDDDDDDYYYYYYDGTRPSRLRFLFPNSIVEVVSIYGRPVKDNSRYGRIEPVAAKQSEHHYLHTFKVKYNESPLQSL